MVQERSQLNLTWWLSFFMIDKNIYPLFFFYPLLRTNSPLGNFGRYYMPCSFSSSGSFLGLTLIVVYKGEKNLTQFQADATNSSLVAGSNPADSGDDKGTFHGVSICRGLSRSHAWGDRACYWVPTKRME